VQETVAHGQELGWRLAVVRLMQPSRRFNGGRQVGDGGQRVEHVGNPRAGRLEVREKPPARGPDGARIGGAIRPLPPLVEGAPVVVKRRDVPLHTEHAERAPIGV
jgi:hypothetical protein